MLYARPGFHESCHGFRAIGAHCHGKQDGSAGRPDFRDAIPVSMQTVMETVPVSMPRNGRAMVFPKRHGNQERSHGNQDAVFTVESLYPTHRICYGTISRAPKTQVSYNITLLSVVPWCPPTGLSVGPRCTAVYSVGEEAITLGIMCTHTLRPGNQRESMRITTGIMELCAHLNL